jgi:HK97 family phage prohead protease
MAKMLHTKAEVVRGKVSPEEGVVEAIVGSSGVLDRMGDIIDQNGWDLKSYIKTNPAVLWGHNIREERPPIGKALKVWLQDKGEKTAKLMFKVKFDLRDTFAAEIFRKVKEGFINAVSVGFLPIEWEALKPKEGEKSSFFGGRKYTKQELLELSFVPVPANPEAIIALRSMSKKDSRFAPVELKDLYPQVDTEIMDSEKDVKGDEVQKPYPNEHACRLRDPGDFDDGTFRRMKRKHDGKEYSVILGKLHGEDTMTEQAYRYAKDVWDAGSARTHCKDHGGSFEAASGKQVGDEGVEEKPVEETPVEEKPVEETPEGEAGEVPEGEVSEETPSEEAPKTEEGTTDEGESGEVPSEEGGEESPEEGGETPSEERPQGEPQTPQPAIETKGVIPFKDLGTLPESADWDGGAETKKAEIDDLKLMCAWYDSDEPDNKGSYKLPHHTVDGHKCVWRGTAAAMAALMGARGGVEIPAGDKRGVYNHLAKHYRQFDKEPPEFRLIEEQILGSLEEEIHALMLDREDRYMVRLIKKVLQGQKKVTQKVEPIKGYTLEQVKSALGVLDSALSQLLVNGSTEGGEKKG